MFGLEDSRRYYVCQHYVRMNLGINGLSKIVSNELKRPLLNGEAFTFFGFDGKPAAYMVVFCICAVAYLIGWVVMKTLVPKYKPIVVE